MVFRLANCTIVKVTPLASPRSYDGKYFASLGGQDDNSVVIWETETGRAVCGSPAAQDSALSVKWLHHRNDRFVTAGNFHLRVWQVDVSIPKVRAGRWLSWRKQEGRGRGCRRVRVVSLEGCLFYSLASSADHAVTNTAAAARNESKDQGPGSESKMPCDDESLAGRVLGRDNAADGRVPSSQQVAACGV